MAEFRERVPEPTANPRAEGAAGYRERVPEPDSEEEETVSGTGATGFRERLPEGSEVADSNEYTDSLGDSGQFAQALDYPANAWRTALNDSGKAQEAGGGLLDQLAAFYEGGKGGLKKERGTSVEDLRKTLEGLQEKGLSLSPLPIWSNASSSPNQFINWDTGDIDWWDVPETIRNVVLGGATDPLGAVAGPVIGKAGSLVSKGAQAASKVMRPASVAQKAAQAVTPGIGAAAVTGGVLGGAMTGKDDSGADFLGNVAKGTVLLGGMGLGGKTAGRVAKGIGDAVADKSAVLLKGEKFRGISAAKELKASGDSKALRAEVDMLQDYGEKFTGIKPDAELAAGKVNEGLKTEFITRRNFALSQNRASLAAEINADNDAITAAIGGRKITKETSVGEAKEIQALKKRLEANDAKLSKAMEADGYSLLSGVEKNTLNEAIAADMHADGTVTKALQNQAESSVTGYNATTKFNEEMTEKINREIYGQADGKWNRETGEGIAGIPFHIEDLRPLKELDEIFQGTKSTGKTGSLKMAQSTERGVSREALGPRESKELYIKGMARNWMAKEERKAAYLVAEYRAAPAVGVPQRAADATLKLLDSAGSLMKKNMLAISLAWVKNNFPDNVKRAYHQAGLLGAFDAATMGRFQTGVWEDVRNVMKGNLVDPFKSKYTKGMTRQGVLGSNIGSEVDPLTDAAEYYMRPEAIAKAKAAAKGPTSKLGKAGKAVALPFKAVYYPFDKFGDLVMHVGSRMENSAKAAVYIRAMKTMEADPAIVKQLGQEGMERVAADITKKTFFDYSDVTEFERMYAKRLFPFYTFFKKNAQYYANQFQNPKMLGRLARANSFRDWAYPETRQLTRDEEAGMPQHFSQGDPRFAGKTPDGVNILHSPQNSMFDARSMLSLNQSNLAIQKANPLLKGPIELMANIDTFTGDKMKPSSLKDNEKHLFAMGHGHLAGKKGIEAITEEGPVRDFLETITGVNGVKLDDSGKNPVSTENLQVWMDRLSPLAPNSLVIPKPLIRQSFGSAGKVATGKSTLGDVLHNLVNTHQMSTISDTQMDYLMKKNKDVKEEENEAEYRKKQAEKKKREANKP